MKSSMTGLQKIKNRNINMLLEAFHIDSCAVIKTKMFL